MNALYPPLIALSLGLAAGCASQIPATSGISYVAYEPTIQSGQQWNAIAADIAQRLQTALISPDSTQSVVLHVARSEQGIFNEAFYQLLSTQLLEHGFGVTDDPAAGLTATFDAQFVNHDEFVAPNLVVKPSREIIVNVAVRSGERFVTRISDIYPVSYYDYALYLAQVAPTRRMEVVGP